MAHRQWCADASTLNRSRPSQELILLSTEIVNIALSIALAALLAVMAILLFVLFRRGRTESDAAAPRPPGTAAPLAAAPPPAAVAQPEMIASMAERAGARAYAGAPVDAADDEEYVEYDPAPHRGSEAATEAEAGILHILTDPDTGLENRWAWDRLVREENLRKRRYSRPLSVVVAELYGIDKLAERVGQEPADRLILAVGEALRRYSRSSDRIARVDTARFHILLPETDEANVVHFIERVRTACDLWLEAGAVSLHLAMGWASSAADEPIEAAMITARERLITDLRKAARRAG
jgi:diguanylate cyclase (GGDEF)-like protein